jgi:hypothetical protein
LEHWELGDTITVSADWVPGVPWPSFELHMQLVVWCWAEEQDVQADVVSDARGLELLALLL